MTEENRIKAERLLLLMSPAAIQKLTDKFVVPFEVAVASSSTAKRHEEEEDNLDDVINSMNLSTEADYSDVGF